MKPTSAAQETFSAKKDVSAINMNENVSAKNFVPLQKPGTCGRTIDSRTWKSVYEK